MLVDKLLLARSQPRESISRGLAAREDKLSTSICLSLGRRTALERAAYLLLHLFVPAEKPGCRERKRSVSLHAAAPSRYAGHVVGSSDKTLKRFFFSKAVRWKDRVFEIVDRAALVNIAGSDAPHHRPRPFI